ncbi:MAG: hypothetical protein ABL903_15435 [Methylococcales bacterium]
MESAIGREKALKKWNRDWKLKLIEKTNPQWLDLWPEIIGSTGPRTTTHRHSRLRGNDEADDKRSDQDGFL